MAQVDRHVAEVPEDIVPWQAAPQLTVEAIARARAPSSFCSRSAMAGVSGHDSSTWLLRMALEDLWGTLRSDAERDAAGVAAETVRGVQGM